MAAQVFARGGGHGGGGHHGGGHHGGGHHGGGHHGQDPTTALTRAVGVKGIMEHESARQAFADPSTGTRTMTSPGFSSSVDYVYNRLRKAGYNTQKVPFDFPDF